jgi:hypothetical protein
MAVITCSSVFGGYSQFLVEYQKIEDVAATCELLENRLEESFSFELFNNFLDERESEISEYICDTKCEETESEECESCNFHNATLDSDEIKPEADWIVQKLLDSGYTNDPVAEDLSMTSGLTLIMYSEE